ncbi:Hpt domain-containing protein, partial [Escherichia coli]
LDISRELTKRYPREDLPPLVALTANPSVISFGPTSSRYCSSMGISSNASDLLFSSVVTVLSSSSWVSQNFLITDGLAVFERMMPGYVSVLESNLTAQDKKGIVEEGHKIKGAAGSVGLRHLQQLGQQIQSPDLPAWEDNVGEWIEEMKEEWRHDVEVLKAWVAKATKK